MPELVFSEAIPQLLIEHLLHLNEGSGINLDVIKERGYRSILGKADLANVGFTSSQQRTSGILIPLWGVDGGQVGYQYRPDNPRLDSRQRPVKYESPVGSSNHLDCPPRCKQMLGDPKTPLWITEGSKKADALASHGACVICLTGVWGFKGKNEFGAVTLLADWDRIAIKDRLVYLAFDSDVVSKDLVRKALEHLGEHLSRKGASILVVYLPQEGNQKCGIDDYLLSHSLEDARKLATDFRPADEQSRERFVPGFVLHDGTIGELIVSPEDERAFIIVVNGSVRKVFRYETPKAIYLPSDDPLVTEVVHFASTATPYDSQARLFSEIKGFIHRYLEIPPDFEEISALYVLLTWVYEFAPSIPYLRVIGDWGTGKTRFLQVVGSVCFRPTFASGATTPAPIFRVLEQFRGTLVLDEADFKDSSSWVEMVKLLNNGYRPGMPVLRADKENGKWFPRSYQVFGPKLIATRFPFQDEALESRCLTSEMMPLTRDDIPRVLPPAFEKEIDDLRAKLLTFRLANLIKLKGKTFGNELLEPNLQPRLQEILIPLKAMLNGDHSMVEAITGFVHRLQENLFLRRRESATGRVLAALIELHEEGKELTSDAVAKKANETDDEVEQLSAEKVGRLTKKLGFAKERMGKSRQRLICWDETRVTKIVSSYGLQMALPLSPEKPSEPSLLSALASNPADSNKEGLKYCPPYCPPKTEADTSVGADSRTERTVTDDELTKEASAGE
ncbi:DUF3854 domain-containing protein [Dehalococcoides mccartyi]|uniref:DUF3854 domain-containing protein n=1 Tax=Dehalococcoides mccartyi TaxID=61435 RepID=A0A142V807_9CHLR|nr:DUF3854 domain-containing protein [Dehalococcoides mccartyi]AMU85954.1 hypothetical protein Dm11a5_0123 [Dehalococcoides mccartyi]